MTPSHALAFREGAAKRWQGCVQAGLLSREINEIGVLTSSLRAEGNIASSVSASCWWTPRGRRTRACTEPPCARTGRARACPSVWSAGGPLRER